MPGWSTAFETLRDAWLERASGLGAPITARLPHETRQGVFEGIDASGALLLNERRPGARHRRRRGVLLMLLAIDAGNTNIVFALYDGETMRAQWRAVTQVSRTADEYAVWLSQLLALEGLSFADLDAAIIATVVPAVLFDLRDLCRKYLKTEPLRVGDPALDLGPKPRVDRPETVGADRLCNTVAAHERYPGRGDRGGFRHRHQFRHRLRRRRL